MRSLAFVQQCFHDYYAKDFSLDGNLWMTKEREFGFVSFQGWMQRHKGFQNKDELLSFLISYVPRDSYISCARYEDPEADMDKKGWLGADLIFDIDADHIPTPCNKIHDEWTCGMCGFGGKGIVPEKCPACNGEKFSTSTWPCEVCLDSAKTETAKVLDMLTRDFGFSGKDLHVFFSGHRGYHIHVESAAVETLDTIARKEIVDYVSGLGLDQASHGVAEKKSIVAGSYQAPSLDDLGWRRRIALGVKNFIGDAREQDLLSIGIGGKETKAILRNREVFMKRWLEKGTMGVLKGAGPETWSKIVGNSITLQSARVDTVVTTDIHRLIRLQDTLHGKTGLKKLEFPASEMTEFDPFEEAIAFKGGTATVSVSDAPKFRLDGQMFGPYKNQRVELPTAAAVLLVCKGRAMVDD